ncbi:lipopolysaccharide transport periplasmic protein LptA [Luteimonas vadosa]|uniref:Lipopolysaccharide export system protein LptA n=1 Tax=Luteimonas vadosa TaxID=1165507 RepID=A0ABP9E0T5_9GAMM
MPQIAASLSAAACLLVLAGGAWAKSSDRNQPMDIDANSSNCSIGDNSPCVFSGNVHIVQGTLDIRAAKADVRRGGGDIQRVIITGSPARLSQGLDNGGTMTASASTVEYDMPRETVIFTGNVRIEQAGRGAMSGPRIVYNMQTGQVQGGGGEGGGQIRTRILPRAAQGNKQGSD